MCPFSGGLNFPPEAEFPIIDFVWDGKFLTDSFVRLQIHSAPLTVHSASRGVRPRGLGCGPAAFARRSAFASLVSAMRGLPVRR